MSKEAKETLKNATYTEITSRLQAVINDYCTERSIWIPAITKDKYGNIKIREVYGDYTELHEVNWGAAYEGLQVYKPKYGLVIYVYPSQTSISQLHNRK